MIDLLSETSPVELYKLAHAFNRKIEEAGNKIKWS